MRPSVISFVLGVNILQLIGVSCVSERDLYGALLSNYSTKVRPVLSASDTIQVQVELDFVQLVDLDEKRQTLKAIVWILQRWTDEYLKWPDDNYDGLEYLVLRAKDIWTPDLYVQNSLGNTDYTLDEFLINGETIKTRRGGQVERAPAFLLQSWCTVDVTFYPFDIQKCPVIVSSWSYTESTMNLTASRASVERILDNSEWQVFDITFETTLKKYECCADRYPEIHYMVHMKRKPSYYVVILVAPLIMLHVLSTFSFMVPADSGERLSYGLTTFLALSVFSMTIGEKVPESSISIPVVSVNLALAMSCNMISLLWSVFVIRCWGQTVDDTCCFNLLYGLARKLAPLLCIQQTCAKGSGCEDRGGGQDTENGDDASARLNQDVRDNCKAVSVRRTRVRELHRHGHKPQNRSRRGNDQHASPCKCNFVLRVVDKLFFVLFLLLLLLSELILVVIIPMMASTPIRFQDSH